MKNLTAVFATLRKKGRGQYLLLSGCLFFAVLLITAFSMMMYSPTVQTVLPQGGDSRKQVMMIFVLAVIGCGAFSLYAAGLFFRYKSREAGVLLALGMSRRALNRQLCREVLGLTLESCGAGLILGTPLCWGIWSLFRLFLVDTPEMLFIFNLRAYIVPFLFFLFVLFLLLIMENRFLARVNVLDIIHESHRPEPVRAVPSWYGWGGVLLIVLGSSLGYFAPSFCVRVLQWYAPGFLTAVFYLPALVGLYWVLLFTVVGGWHRGKRRYAHLIESGMMQFQGRQTVRNMLVVTVLVAGAYFASFYTPMMMTSSQAALKNREADYQFFYRADQEMISQAEIQELAQSYSAQVVNYREVPSVTLAIDGETEVETEGPMGVTYTVQYQEMRSEGRFFSVSAWNTLAGDNLTLESGQCIAFLDRYGYPSSISLVTNPVTGQSLKVETLPSPLSSRLLSDIYLLSDQDYAQLIQGLTPEWQEVQVVFDAENDSYALAKDLFHRIVESSGPEMAIFDGYDRISKMNAEKAGEVYWGDQVEELNLPVIDLTRPDSSSFRTNWLYMPQFQALDEGDFLSTYAVYLLLFIFISILCFAAVSVILYTRSQSLILSNLWVYEDLHKLGASAAYRRKTAQGQVKRVFLAPLLTGTVLILCFYLLILLGNGRVWGIDVNEAVAFAVCLALAAICSTLFYLLYRFTLKQGWRLLKL